MADRTPVLLSGTGSSSLVSLDEDGVWDFARGCMRSYLILKEKAQQFCQHAAIQALIAEIRDAGDTVGVGPYTRERPAS